MLRRRRKTSRLEVELIDRFKREVYGSMYPLLANPDDDSRASFIDPHHVIPKQRIEYLCYCAGLSEEETLERKWDPDIGVPVERDYHELLTTGARKLSRAELRPENIEYARRHDWLSQLELFVPDLLRSEVA